MVYILSSFRDNSNYCLEIKSPYGKKFHAFPTHDGYIEYLENFKWHLKMSGRHYEWEDDLVNG